MAWNSRLIGYYGQCEDDEEVVELNSLDTSCEYMNEMDWKKCYEINSNKPQYINKKYVDFQKIKNSSTFYDTTHLRNYVKQPNVANVLKAMTTLILARAGLLDDWINGMLFEKNRKPKRVMKFQVSRNDNDQRVIELWSEESGGDYYNKWIVTGMTAPSHILTNYRTDENGRIRIGYEGAYRVMQHGFKSMPGVALVTSKEQDSFVGKLKNAVEIKTVRWGSYVNHTKVITRTGILGGMSHLCVIIVDETEKYIKRVIFNENLNILDDKRYRQNYKELIEKVIRFIVDFIETSEADNGSFTLDDNGFTAEGNGGYSEFHSKFRFPKPANNWIPRGIVVPKVLNILYVFDKGYSVNDMFPNNVTMQLASSVLNFGPLLRPSLAVLFVRDPAMAANIRDHLQTMRCKAVRHTDILDCVRWTERLSDEDFKKYGSWLMRNKVNVANMLNQLTPLI